MDFMTFLPVEVIEQILIHLSGKEIINCCKVSKVWASFINQEVLWRQLCVRNGFSVQSKKQFTLETAVESWREYYWSIYNWHHMNFVCHTIEDDGAIEQVQLSGTMMIIPGRDRIKIWNIEHIPKLEQQLESVTCKNVGFCLRVSGKYLVYESGSIVQVYLRESSSYNFFMSKIFFFESRKLADCKSIDDLYKEYADISCAYHLAERDMNSLGYCLIELNEDTLAVFQGEVLFIWFLSTWQRNTVIMPEEVDCIYAVRILLPRLYLVALVNSQYIIKVYDLDEMNWVMNLEHTYNEDHSLMLQPRLIVGEKFIVTAGVWVSDPMPTSRIYLKVWNTSDGSLISNNSIPYCYFNCFLINEIIIMTTSANVITVWAPLTNKKLGKLTLHDNKFSLMKPVSKNLLVVSYSNFFEVWDWHTSSRLYETDPKLVCSYNQKMNSLYYIQPDALSNDLMPHELNKAKKIMIFNFRESKRYDDN